MCTSERLFSRYTIAALQSNNRCRCGLLSEGTSLSRRFGGCEYRVVELKALPAIDREHIAQTLNDLRATGLQVGLILNFGPKAQIKRVIYTRIDQAPVQM